ncbi:hypothetical protein C7212DRAFT_356929 [Tuber magnatum]|uniref:Potassium channel domain-containing protein n=1 Tax=Tuber magnatum TaxID=42249 RepID=A0A317SVT3_9PEZI|nr:hypothetical protein C7212DRAFT_356929 [Tuber magnatum]
MNDPDLDEPTREQTREVERSLRGGARKADGESTSRRRSGGGSRIGSPRAQLGGELVKEGDDNKVEKALAQPKFVVQTCGGSPPSLFLSWRLRIPPGGKETEAWGIDDPAWLIAINAVSLTFALVANVCLLLTFARRIRYQLSQPIVIIFWYISSFLLIALVAATPKHLQLYPRQEYAFSQSYYYGILSSTLYFIVATFLLANYFNSIILKRYPPIFNRPTLSQRALMLQTISLTFYHGVGALVFSKIEGWEYVDGIYWADYTLLTVGLGSDFKLEKTLSRALLIPYAIGGIIILGLVVGSVRSLVLERGKIKVQRRAIEKERMKWIKRLEEEEQEQEGSRSRPKSEEEKLLDEFRLMRKIEKTANRKSKWTSLATSLTAFLFLWLGGAMVFTFSERRQKWSYFESLYFTYVTLLTIGYGDLYPESNSGKPFFVVWTIIAVPTLTILISNMGNTVVGMIQKATFWVGARTVLPDLDINISLTRKLRLMKRTNMEKQLEKSVVTTANTFPERAHNLQEKEPLPKQLAVEIRMLTKHVTSKPPKKYSFEEWVRFLGLLGIGWKEGDKWSWLDEGGPLASSLSETEWLLEKMCQRLEGNTEILGGKEGIREVHGHGGDNRL